MPNGKTPEDTGEHLMALYGHVEGLKKDVGHLHRDIEKLNDSHQDKDILCLMGILMMVFLEKSRG